MISDTIRDSRSYVSNHQVVIGDNEEARHRVLDAVTATLTDDTGLLSRFRALRIGKPRRGTLRELWEHALESAGAAARPAAPAVDTQTGRELALAGLINLDRRAHVLVVSALDEWARRLAELDEEWALRKILQTEPAIVLLGECDRWTADHDPSRALYHGVGVRLVR